MLDIINPATEDVLESLDPATEDDADRAIARAREAFPAWRDVEPADRSRLLRRLADALDAEQEKLAQLESRNTGKPIGDSRGEMGMVAETFYYYAGMPERLLGDTIPVSGGVNVTFREPLGVVGLIVPWNFPLTIASWKMAPALAAGNTFVLKPAELTPLTAIEFERIVREAGIPDGVVNVLVGPGSKVGKRLVEHPDVAKVAFTGSTEVGRGIMAGAAGTIKRVTLELGGKSANIVLADADMDAALRGAISSTFRNQGEICTAGARLVVERPAAGPLVERLTEHVAAIKLGRGLDPATEMGPLISERHRRRVLALFDSARNEGAVAAVGGGAATVADYPDGHFVEPTIFTGTHNAMRINREEIFGPAVAVIEVDSAEQAVEVANDTPFGLAAGVFTRDGARAHRIARALRAGTVWINMYGGLDPYSTFSGRGLSGRGYELGPESIGEYTAVKTIKTAVGV